MKIVPYWFSVNGKPKLNRYTCSYIHLDMLKSFIKVDESLVVIPGVSELMVQNYILIKRKLIDDFYAVFYVIRRNQWSLFEGVSNLDNVQSWLYATLEKALLRH